MIILNFSHPLTSEQESQVAALAGQPVTEVINIPVQFNNEADYVPQLGELMADMPLTPHALQSEPIVVNLPSLNFIAALLLAELHGRMGYFPTILRLRPDADSLPPRYEVAELFNLQRVRDAARQARR